MKKNHVADVAVMSIGFWWLGLTSAPGAGPLSEIVETGLYGTVAAIAGFTLVAYLGRDRPPSSPE